MAGYSWYVRLARERMLWDSLHRMADPDAEQSFRRMQRAQQDYGSELVEAWRGATGKSSGALGLASFDIQSQRSYRFSNNESSPFFKSP